MLRTKVQCKKLVVITRKSFLSKEIAHLSISSSITYVNAILRTRVLAILAHSESERETCPENRTINPSSPMPHRDESFFTISVNKDFFFSFIVALPGWEHILKNTYFLKKHKSNDHFQGCHQSYCNSISFSTSQVPPCCKLAAEVQF